MRHVISKDVSPAPELGTIQYRDIDGDGQKELLESEDVTEYGIEFPDPMVIDGREAVVVNVTDSEVQVVFVDDGSTDVVELSRFPICVDDPDWVFPSGDPVRLCEDSEPVTFLDSYWKFSLSLSSGQEFSEVTEVWNKNGDAISKGMHVGRLSLKGDEIVDAGTVLGFSIGVYFFDEPFLMADVQSADGMLGAIGIDSLKPM